MQSKVAKSVSDTLMCRLTLLVTHLVQQHPSPPSIDGHSHEPCGISSSPERFSKYFFRPVTCLPTTALSLILFFSVSCPGKGAAGGASFRICTQWCRPGTNSKPRFSWSHFPPWSHSHLCEYRPPDFTSAPHSLLRKTEMLMLRGPEGLADVKMLRTAFGTCWL